MLGPEEQMKRRAMLRQVGVEQRWFVSGGVAACVVSMVSVLLVTVRSFEEMNW